MSETPTGTPPGIAAGTRVRPDAAFPPGTAVKYRDDLVNLRSWDICTGVVQSGASGFGGEHVLVRWGDRPEPDWEAVVNLAVVAPASGRYGWRVQQLVQARDALRRWEDEHAKGEPCLAAALHMVEFALEEGGR